MGLGAVMKISPIGLTVTILGMCGFSYLASQMLDSYWLGVPVGIVIGWLAVSPTKCNSKFMWER